MKLPKLPAAKLPAAKHIKSAPMPKLSPAAATRIKAKANSLLGGK